MSLLKDLITNNKDYSSVESVIENICKENNISTHSSDYGFYIYPKGYGEDDNKDFFYEIISQKEANDQHNFTINLVEDVTKEQFVNFLNDFNNNIIESNILTLEVVDYRSNKKTVHITIDNGDGTATSTF